MATGPNWSGLSGWLYQTATTPGRWESRLNKVKKSRSVERKVLGWACREPSQFSSRVKIEFFHVPNLLCCNHCESVICMEFSHQNKGLEPILKKTIIVAGKLINSELHWFSGITSIDLPTQFVPWQLVVPYLCNKTTRPLWLHLTGGSRGPSPWFGHRVHSSR